MLEAEIRRYAESKGFHAQTVERWLAWDEADGQALYRLAASLKIGENHLRDLMDWLEEIALRDQTKITHVLENEAVGNIASDPRLGRADRLKRIKDELRRLRFPRLAQIEDAIRARIKELGLPAAIRFAVPPGLEGGRLWVEFSAASHGEMRELCAKLAAAVEQAPAAAIFALLTGKAFAEPEADNSNN